METASSAKGTSRAKVLLCAVGILAGTLAVTASLRPPGSLSLSADVSEAAPVVHVWGMLPEGAKHEYLGTYERFDLDTAAKLPAVVEVMNDKWFAGVKTMRSEIAGEFIYFKQGNPWMAMWRSGENNPGWWYVGHTAQALGGADDDDAILGAYSSAVAPEHINSPWYAKTSGFDTKHGGRWLDAPGLHVNAGPVGAEALLGAPAVHLRPIPLSFDHPSFYAGTYYRRDSNLVNDHAVYVKHFAGCHTSLAVMWYSSNGWWKVGVAIDGTIGKDEDAHVAAYDQALVPEGVTSPWYVEDAEGKWEAARELHVETGPISPEEALQGSSVVHLSGSLPTGAAHEWLGTYDRRGGDLVNERAVFIHRGDNKKAMWYQGSLWVLTNVTNVGNCNGFPWWGYVSSVAMVPEKANVQEKRYANVAGTMLPAPALRIDAGEAGAAALHGAPSVYLSGELPVNADHSYLGTYDRRGDDLVNDHAVYIMRGDPDKAMWYSRFGRWMVGPASSLGSTAGIFAAYDPADTPEGVNTTWKALIKEARVAEGIDAPSDGGGGVYRRLVRVGGVDRCVEASVSATTASAFGGTEGRCEGVGYTVPTGSQAIPFCCTVQGFKRPPPSSGASVLQSAVKDEWIEAAGLKTGVTVVLKWKKILNSHVCGKKKMSFAYTVGGADISTMEFEQHSQQGDHSWNLHAHGMLEGLAQLTPLLPLVAGAAREGRAAGAASGFAGRAASAASGGGLAAGVARAGQATGAASGFASSFADLPEKTEYEASIDFKVNSWALEQKAHQMVSRTDSWEKTETSEIEGDAWFQDRVLTVMCRFEKQLQASMDTGMATWNMGLPFTQQCFYTMTEGTQSKCSCSSAAAGIAGTEEC